MLVLFSGEGSTDVGDANISQMGICAPGNWRPGPMAWLAAQIFEDELGYPLLESSAYFISEAALVGYARTLRRPPLRGVGRSLYHRRVAMGLAALSLKLGEHFQQPVTGVLFRDCDGSNSASRTRWEDLHVSISGERGGFRSMGLNTGVAMLPKPKSEAWLLCALREPRSQHCESLEYESGNDKGQNSLKNQLELCVGNCSAERIVDLLKEDDYGRLIIDAKRIIMPSFLSFNNEFRCALRKTEINWRVEDVCDSLYIPNATNYLMNL